MAGVPGVQNASVRAKFMGLTSALEAQGEELSQAAGKLQSREEREASVTGEAAATAKALQVTTCMHTYDPILL
jgi:predicted HAD superfamily Cof-like phosphohydrolase